MRVIYRKIRHTRYLYIKRSVEKVWGARYLSKNTVVNNNTEILCITRTLEQDYISLSTVGIQLHVSALYVDHLHVVTQI